MDTFKQLVNKLNQATLEDFPKVLHSINIPLTTFLNCASWEENSYTRNCIYKSDKYEIILLCWDKDVETPIHDHGGQDCWVYQVDGKIEETLFDTESSDNPISVSKRIISAGGLTYMNDKIGYHSIKNISGRHAMTLHIYNSPIDSCNVYNSNDECFENKEMCYDTHSEVLEREYSKETVNIS